MAYEEPRLHIGNIRPIRFDHARNALVVNGDEQNTNSQSERKPIIGSWWEQKRISQIRVSDINFWLNTKAARDADEMGVSLNPTDVYDEAVNVQKLEEAILSARGSHIAPETIMREVARVARGVAAKKRNSIPFVGEYLLDFTDKLVDFYGLNKRSEERLKRIATLV